MAASLFVLLTTGCTPTVIEDDDPPGTEADADTDADADADADADTDTDTDADADALEGSTDGEGFGAAVAFVGEDLYIGAPHGDQGRVLRYRSGKLEDVVEADGRAGSALAGGSALLIGAPLTDGGSGAVLDVDGSTLHTGSSAGLAVAWADEWLAATATGWQSATDSGTTPARPASIAALSDGSSWTVGVGMLTGDVALVAGGLSFARLSDQDEAGFALAAGDVDGDGQVEWILGAPGAGRVDVLSAADLSIEATLSGTGRFGAALAVGDVDGDGIDDLLIGSPNAGESVEGAAALYTGGDLSSPAATFTGTDTGDQLGFAVAVAPGVLALGAPGGAGQPGRVEHLTIW